MCPIVLTTDTSHHTWFVRELSRVYPRLVVVEETETVRPRFEAGHPFEARRDAYERDRFALGSASLADVCDPHRFASINDPAAVKCVEAVADGLVIDFGTRKLDRPILASCAGRAVNLHGGDPEEYRGLDSHLWAIYHRDWNALVTTLHLLAPELDTGDVVLQGRIPLRRGMELHELRAENTVLCLQLVLASLSMYERLGSLIHRPQRRPGRYYSFMPAPLKAICATRFSAHTATL